MKKAILSVIALALCVLPQSCNKNNGGSEAAQTAKLGVSIKNAQEIYEVPKSQSVSLEVTVVAEPTSAEPYTITVAPSSALVAAYNTKNGTSYEMLPATAFQFVTSSVILPKYTAQSSTCELRLKGVDCEEGVTYILPVVIDGVKGGTNYEAPDENAAYILYQMCAAKAPGAGTQEDPYTINGIDTFMLIGSLLKDDATVYFKLTDDVDFAGTEFGDENPWVPFNNAVDDDAKPAARARKIVFDGNNHKIMNFKANGPLFGTVCGSIMNLTVEKAEIVASAEDAAVVVAVAGSSDNAEDFVMKNVTVKESSVESVYKRAGSVISHLRNGVVENCVADCSVYVQQQAGGLIGRVDAGTITGCSATGESKVDTYYAGGLIGFAGDVTVKNCSATGNAISLSGNYSRAGGLIGQLEGNATIEKCHATGNIEGMGHMGGGLIGVIGKEETTVNISKCYATGNVTMPHGDTGNWAHAGGLVGTISALNCVVAIDNCYATGAIATRRYSGGFVGSIYDKAKGCKSLTITNSYCTSDLSGIAVGDRCGIVLGLNDGANSTVPTVITCTGFVAWNVSEKPFSYNDAVSTEGNYYGTEGTVSAQAKALGWDESIWDLSGNEPKLK